MEHVTNTREREKSRKIDKIERRVTFRSHKLCSVWYASSEIHREFRR